MCAFNCHHYKNIIHTNRNLVKNHFFTICQLLDSDNKEITKCVNLRIVGIYEHINRKSITYRNVSIDMSIVLFLAKYLLISHSFICRVAMATYNIVKHSLSSQKKGGQKRFVFNSKKSKRRSKLCGSIYFQFFVFVLPEIWITFR